VICQATSTPDPNGEDYCGFGTQLICRAFYWQHGGMIVQPTLGGNNGSGFGTNDLGDLAGSAENKLEEPTCAGTGEVLQYKPVLWRQGRVHELPTLGNDPVGVACAINDWNLCVRRDWYFQETLLEKYQFRLTHDRAAAQLG
jgi:hypothetical protein